MDIIDKDIRLAKNMINYNTKRIIFSSIYPFTTENIKEYYNLFDFKNKDVLTIGSSGDHTLNLYLEDTRSIDFFDINPFSKYYFDLKFGAIKSLKYKEFLKFFCNNYPNDSTLNTDKFDDKLYSKIELDGDSKLFWDNLFSNFNGYDIRDSILFNKDEPYLTSIIRINSYLSKKNYDKLGKLEKKSHTFINSELTDLPSKLTKKYDVIMLSNIPQYIEINKKIRNLKRFKIVIDELVNYLNEEGIIILSYNYDKYYTYKNIDNTHLIYQTNKVEELFGKKHIYFIEINSIQGVKYRSKMPVKDEIIIYKK